MRSSGDPSSPLFSSCEPMIFSGDMEVPYQDPDAHCFNPILLETTSTIADREFDDHLFGPTTGHPVLGTVSCLSPAELSLKQHDRSSENLAGTPSPPSDMLSDSPSHNSSTNSPGSHMRNDSLASNNSAVYTHNTMIRFSPPPWPSSDGFSVSDEPLFGPDVDMNAPDCSIPTEEDLESSNKAMDSAFDFDSAASSPSPLKMDSVTDNKARINPLRTPFRGSPRANNQLVETNSSPLFHNSTPSFHFQGLTKETPSAPVVPGPGRSDSRHWDRHSQSSSGLEETFGGITMNGGSPLNPTLSPSLNFGVNGFCFESLKQPSVPSVPVQEFATSPFQAKEQRENHLGPKLIVHPTSLKSRVETQIPIKLTLYPLPIGVKKLRLPSHAISKPKFLAKPDTQRSPEILELQTSVVCTSAMQDKEKLERAFARARGEEHSHPTISGSDSDGSQNVEESPLDGGEVKICAGCIQRERKRASRKKQRKPEEDELFQRDEDKRVIVFNTSELKDWVEPQKTPLIGNSELPSTIVPSGSMQVELPMRIACYCRHQNEKLGFQVIFTIKDHMHKLVAQAITNSIMITDDHKTHAPTASVPSLNSVGPDGGQVPGAGVFATSSNVDLSIPVASHPPPFKISHSTTDLQGLRNSHKPHYPLSPGSLGLSQNSSVSPPAGFMSRTFSRQTSPIDLQGPSAKRRKQSASSKVPAILTMTKVETLSPSTGAHSSNATNTGSRLPPNLSTFTGAGERPFVIPPSMTSHFTAGPPTPNTTDSVFFNPSDRPQTGENIPPQQLMSAPPSAQPSRPGTPGGASRSNFQDQSVNGSSGSVMPNPLWGIPQPNPSHRLPAMIHKLVPAEGSTTGGSEVTLLGSGFFPGMEVVFGDTLATTTTFWGEKCLNCLTPPALQPGTVPVVFKHEHPTLGQGHQQRRQTIIPKQQIFFRYVDDRELQMYRVALGILGQKLGNPADAFQIARQIMGGDPHNLWNLQNNFQANGQQRHTGGVNTQGNSVVDLDVKMLALLRFIDLDGSSHQPRFNLRSTSGQTLLHFASSLGLTRLTTGLLARGASPDAQDNNGNTPLHLAALSGHTYLIGRLRLAGANPAVRNLHGFTPADLAISLAAHQAALIPNHHRSRSVGSSPSIRRPRSSCSLDKFWDSSSSINYPVGSSDESSDESPVPDAVNDVLDSVYYYPQSRRASSSLATKPPFYLSGSCEGSIPSTGVLVADAEEPQVEVPRGFSPYAGLVAWRNQLAAQINQFHQSVNRAFPNLPALALPPMPTLPDYQTYPVMRRITSLVPHRPTTSWSTTIVKDSWDRLTGNSSPPAYEELYPGGGTDEDYAAKKSSIIQAVAETVADRHFESVTNPSASNPIVEDIGDVRIGRKFISPEQQEQLRMAHARKMKKIRSDRNLFFIWIPLLILIVIGMLKNLVPDILHGVSQVYHFAGTRGHAGTAEV